MSNDLLQILQETKVVAVLRGIADETADETAEALFAGGIRLLEVTMNTPGALSIIGRWRERFAGRTPIGAGTVIDLAMAKEAIAAGAEFLISPNLDEEVVTYGVEKGIEVWPGVMTPSEIVRAWKCGARAVKVFPASALGPSYFREVRGPLGQIPLIATGGLNLENLRSFFDVGITAVGIGSNLTDKSLIESGQFEALTALAQRYVQTANAS
jgi:2-dehydro-3-deoxyphosphogluconate aldolase/(4S)-4-hydroxy-2-oxoglutarate aldolase